MQLDISSETGIFQKVFNLAAKKTYKKRSDRFKRMVSEDNNLLAVFSTIDDMHENPYRVLRTGVER